MKPIIASLVSLLFCLPNSFAQVPEVMWEKQLSLNVSHYFADVAELPDGGFILFGAIEKPGERNFDLWLLHCNSNGDTLNTKVFAAAGNDIPMRILSAGNEGYLLASVTEDTDKSVRTRLRYLDSGFNEQWTREGEQPTAVLRSDVAAGTSGRIFWLNTFTGTEGNLEVSVTTLDMDGNLLNVIQLEEDSPVEGYAIRALPDGTIGVSCRKIPAGDKSAVVVVRFDGEGKTVWKTTIPNEGKDHAPQCLCCSPDNSLLIGGWAGLCYNPDAPAAEQIWDYDYLLTKLDAAGKVVWTHTYNREGSERGTAVAVLPNGTIMAAGKCETSFSGSIGPWLLSVDKNGKMIKDQVYKFRFVKDQAARIICTADGGLLMIGPGYIETDHQLSGWVKKFNPVM